MVYVCGTNSGYEKERTQEQGRGNVGRETGGGRDRGEDEVWVHEEDEAGEMKNEREERDIIKGKKKRKARILLAVDELFATTEKLSGRRKNLGERK